MHGAHVGSNILLLSCGPFKQMKRRHAMKSETQYPITQRL